MLCYLHLFGLFYKASSIEHCPRPSRMRSENRFCIHDTTLVFTLTLTLTLTLTITVMLTSHYLHVQVKCGTLLAL